MQIVAKTLTGKCIPLKLEEHADTDAAKAMIEEQEGIPISQQRLIFDGRKLEGVLKNFGIDDHAVLNLALNIRGGGYQNPEIDKAYQRVQTIKRHIKYGGTVLSKKDSRDLTDEEKQAGEVDGRALTDYEKDKGKLLVARAFSAQEIAAESVELTKAEERFESLKDRLQDQEPPTRKRKRRSSDASANMPPPVDMERVASGPGGSELAKTDNDGSPSGSGGSQLAKTDNESSPSGSGGSQSAKTFNESVPSESGGSPLAKTDNESAPSESRDCGVLAVTSRDCGVLAVTSGNILPDLENVYENGLAALEKEMENARGEVDKLQAERLAITKEKKQSEGVIKNSEENLKKMKAIAKTQKVMQKCCDDLERQISDHRKKNKSIEVRLKGVSDRLKEAEASLKQTEKSVTDMKKLVDEQNVVLNAQSEPVDLEHLERIFNKMVGEQGSVTHCSFVKSLADAEVAEFFGLSSAIIGQVEYEKNFNLEHEFQRLCAGDKSFSRERFFELYDRAA